MLLALDLSATTFRRIHLNYAWAFGYNVLMVPLAAGALYPTLRFQLPPWVRACAAAHLAPRLSLHAAARCCGQAQFSLLDSLSQSAWASPCVQVAGGAMALSSVSVVCSSLLLRRYRPPPPVRKCAASAASVGSRAHCSAANELRS